MKNPWTKKNPYLSMWLSAANAVGGSARGHMMAGYRRQTAKAMEEGSKNMMALWSLPFTAVPKAPPAKKAATGKRRAKKAR